MEHAVAEVYGSNELYLKEAVAGNNTGLRHLRRRLPLRFGNRKNIPAISPRRRQAMEHAVPEVCGSNGLYLKEAVEALTEKIATHSFGQFVNDSEPCNSVVGV